MINGPPKLHVSPPAMKIDWSLKYLLAPTAGDAGSMFNPISWLWTYIMAHQEDYPYGTPILVASKEWPNFGTTIHKEFENVENTPNSMSAEASASGAS